MGMHACIHYLACGVFIYLAKALLCWRFSLFLWTILLQEINVFFKWFISFSVNLGNKLKLTFSEKRGAVELENIYYEIKKNCVYLELSFCWKTNITDSEKKKRSPLLTHSLLDWWCCLGRAASEMAIREQTGWVIFNKTPFKREKQSQISRNGIWNRWNIIMWVYSLKNRENGVMSWSHPCDIIVMWKTPDHTIMCDIMYWELLINGSMASLFSTGPYKPATGLAKNYILLRGTEVEMGG